MLEEKDLEKILENKQRKFNELQIRNERLNEETTEFLKELKVSSEQLTAFIENKENFTEKNWKQLVEEREKLDQRLQTEISSTPNPSKVKQSYASHRIDQHWLFVK